MFASDIVACMLKICVYVCVQAHIPVCKVNIYSHVNEQPKFLLKSMLCIYLFLYTV